MTETNDPCGVPSIEERSDITTNKPDLQRKCPRHGFLPLSRFYPEDLRRNRSQCKRCVADRVALWRAKNPQQTLWRRFIQRARNHFGAEAADRLHWTTYGRPLLGKLISELKDPLTPLVERYILTWSDKSTLDSLCLRIR